MSPEADSEIGIQIQEMYFGGNPREHLRRVGKWDGAGKKAKKGLVVKHVTTLESWSLIPPESSGSQDKAPSSETSHPRSERARLSVHHFPLDSGWGLHLGGAEDLACQAYCMWIDRGIWWPERSLQDLRGWQLKAKLSHTCISAKGMCTGH